MGGVVTSVIENMARGGLVRDAYVMPGRNFKAVNLPFNAAGITQKSYYFAPDNELDGKAARIMGIEIADATTSAKLAMLPAKDSLPTTVLAHGCLFISNDQRDIIATIPLYLLVRRLNNGILFQTDFRDQIWQMCYVEFTDATSISSAVGIPFNVYYDPK